MSDYENFWISLQVGKWRAEVTQKVFSARLAFLFVFTVLTYSFIIAYFLVIPYYIPEISNVELLTPVSTIFGFFVAILGIKWGFESYFIQQRAKPEVITYCGIIEYQNVKTLITFINKGSPVLIRNISLLAVKDNRRILDFLSFRIPSIEIFASSTIFQGWRLLQDGESVGVLEQDIKRAIREIETRLKDEKEVSDLDIAIMAFDEEFDITRQESLNETLLAGCKLGKYSELIKYAKEKKKEFPGLISGLKTYIELPGDFYERLRRKEPVLAKLIGEVPPSVANIDVEIWRKLNSIEKLLYKIVRINRGIKKKRKNKEKMKLP